MAAKLHPKESLNVQIRLLQSNCTSHYRVNAQRLLYHVDKNSDCLMPIPRHLLNNPRRSLSILTSLKGLHGRLLVRTWSSLARIFWLGFQQFLQDIYNSKYQ